MTAPSANVSTAELVDIVKAFSISGGFKSGAAYGSGHINDTFEVVVELPDRSVRRIILQRVNHWVFKNVPALMENIQRVTEHVSRRLAGGSSPNVPARSLTLVPARDGRAFHRDALGGWWRCYHFIEGARTHDIIESPHQAREAARAFGEFQKVLVDLPGGRLNETIPNFHHTRSRFESFRSVVTADRVGRSKLAQGEIEFAHAHEPLVDVLLGLQARGEIPERITHNDTKLNNVMIDEITQRAVCVIDLDTVMPGLGLYDFGDMVRSATNSAAEDERDLSRVQARLTIFEALVEGYLAAARPFLNQAEIDHLVLSGQLITFEIGLRFLTDFLEGDVYFKTKRPDHNLDRARNQFALLRSLELQQTAMEAIVRKHTT